MVARGWYENQLKDGLPDGTYKSQVIQQLKDHVFFGGERPIDQIKHRKIVNCLGEVWLIKKPTETKLRKNNPAPPARSIPKSKH